MGQFRRARDSGSDAADPRWSACPRSASQSARADVRAFGTTCFLAYQAPANLRDESWARVPVSCFGGRAPTAKYSENFDDSHGSAVTSRDPLPWCVSRRGALGPGEPRASFADGAALLDAGPIPGEHPARLRSLRSGVGARGVAKRRHLTIVRTCPGLAAVARTSARRRSTR